MKNKYSICVCMSICACARMCVCVCVCVYRQVFSKSFSEFIFLSYIHRRRFCPRFVESSPEEKNNNCLNLWPKASTCACAGTRMRAYACASARACTHVRTYACAHTRAQVRTNFCRSGLSNPVLKSRKERDIGANCAVFFSQLISIPNLSNYAEM